MERPDGVSRHPAPARLRRVRRPRVPLQPASVVRRSTHRLRPEAARPAACDGRPAPPAAMAELIEIMREQARARHGRFTSELYRGGLARRLYAEPSLRAALARMRAAGTVPEPAPPSGTTHISVVDRRGNAASLTISTGLGLRRDRPGHRHPPEQHARRVRPQRQRREPGARAAAHEHDGAVDRHGLHAAAARGRQRRFAAAARRDHAGGRQRRPARDERRGRDRRSRGSTPTTSTSTSRAGPTGPRSTGWPSSATTSCAGGAATSSSAAQRPSRCARTVRCTRRGIPRRGGHGVVV